MSFPCTACGCCCRRVDKAVETAIELQPDTDVDLSFPYQWDDTGKCEMLGEDNLCKVYENRPLLCRLDDIQKALDIDKDFFYRITAMSCNKLMDEYDIDESFKIVL